MEVSSLWDIASAAVLLEHIVLLQDHGTFSPGIADVTKLSFWGARGIEAALVPAARVLRQHAVEVILAPSGAGFSLRSTASDRPAFTCVEELLQLRGKLCAPLAREGMVAELELVPSLKKTVSVVTELLLETLGVAGEMCKLRNVEVGHAVMFNEQWSVPYEIAWQADGAGLSIVMPDVPRFEHRHFAHFEATLGHRHAGETVLYQFLGTYVIPCHEVLHIVQHLHGLRDSDAKSYAMEHDASRLNYVMLWHVLQRDLACPAWGRWVVMLEAFNRALQARAKFEAGPTSHYEAYRDWADSFGLNSPMEKYGEDPGNKLESMSKILVAGEALALRGGCEPSLEHLQDLLRTAFHSDRRGDVYSSDNRAIVISALPKDLCLSAASATDLWKSLRQEGLVESVLVAVEACRTHETYFAG